MSAELSDAADDSAVKDCDINMVKIIINMLIILYKSDLITIVFLPATIQQYCISCTYLAVMLFAQLAI